MKKIAVFLAALVACLSLAAPALASVDTNLANSVKRVESNGDAKWVVINGTHTAASGTFTATMCSSTFVSTSQVIFTFRAVRYMFGTSTYSNNGNVVHMGNQVTFGSAC